MGELIARAEQPPEKGMLDNLARHYGRALARFFERRIERKSEVPDLVQDVFLRLARMRDPSSIQNPEHYLFATAANTLRDWRRRDSARDGHSHDPFDEMAHGGIAIAPDRILEGKIAVRRVHDALRELPERTRDIFVLRIFEGRRMGTIASSLGISRRAAEKHYVKAMAHICRALEGYVDA